MSALECSSSSGEIPPYYPWPACPPLNIYTLFFKKCFEGARDTPSPSPKGPFTYSAQNDFGRIIHELLFCTPKEGFSAHAFDNLCAIGRSEDFAVIPSDSIYAVRDPKLTTSSGKILEPSCSSSLRKAIDRTTKRNELLKIHTAFLTTHRSFAHGCGGTVAEHKLDRRTYDGIINRREGIASFSNNPNGRIKDSRLYFEGGNTFCITNTKQKLVYLIGQDLLTITHHATRLDGLFKKKNSADPNDPWLTSHFNESIIFGKWKDKINQLFHSGQIPDEVMKIYDRIFPDLTESLTEQVIGEMKVMGNLPQGQYASEEEKKSHYKGMAAHFLAQIEFVATRIFAEELGVAPDQIHFIPQCAYHLDYIMTPGPNGTIFLQDYALGRELLLHIKEQAVILKLTEKDLRKLDCFIQEAEQLGRDFQEIMENTKESLKKADLTVIPTPGAFFSHKEGDVSESEDVNFLNAISGFSNTTKHMYYIASGTNVGDMLGQCLMDAYAEFLRIQCPNIAVYFVGRNPKNSKDYSEAMRVINQRISRLGPHCLSFETKISPNTFQIE